jgi:hypothetical protein
VIHSTLPLQAKGSCSLCGVWCVSHFRHLQVEASESEPVAALELSDAEANVASPALGLVRLRWPVLGNLFDIFVT